MSIPADVLAVLAATKAVGYVVSALMEMYPIPAIIHTGLSAF